MALSPLDIHNKEFAYGFRGYDKDEVNSFLDQIIKDYELTIREKTALKNKVSDLEERLGHFIEIEETLNKSIVIAQETADELKNNARNEAKLIIKEAEKNADRIVDEALSKSRKIAMETEELSRQAKVFRTRFKMLIDGQYEMLNNQDWDEFISTDPLDEVETLDAVEYTDQNDQGHETE